MKLSVKSLKKSVNFTFQFLFAFYQVGLRPYFGYSCKFEPTCSCYSHHAFVEHGVIKGFALTVWRLLRCHPFSEGGFDPIPMKKEVFCGRK